MMARGAHYVIRECRPKREYSVCSVQATEYLEAKRQNRFQFLTMQEPCVGRGQGWKLIHQTQRSIGEAVPVSDCQALFFSSAVTQLGDGYGVQYVRRITCGSSC
jgi:hypothetical protein